MNQISFQKLFNCLLAMKSDCVFKIGQMILYQMGRCQVMIGFSKPTLDNFLFMVHTSLLMNEVLDTETNVVLAGFAPVRAV